VTQQGTHRQQPDAALEPTGAGLPTKVVEVQVRNAGAATRGVPSPFELANLLTYLVPEDEGLSP
jgi:hypothetical protein